MCAVGHDSPPNLLRHVQSPHHAEAHRPGVRRQRCVNGMCACTLTSFRDNLATLAGWLDRVDVCCVPRLRPYRCKPDRCTSQPERQNIGAWCVVLQCGLCDVCCVCVFQEGVTPLMIACGQNDVACATALLDAGAEVNASNTVRCNAVALCVGFCLDAFRLRAAVGNDGVHGCCMVRID